MGLQKISSHACTSSSASRLGSSDIYRIYMAILAKITGPNSCNRNSQLPVGSQLSCGPGSYLVVEPPNGQDCYLVKENRSSVRYHGQRPYPETCESSGASLITPPLEDGATYTEQELEQGSA
jgi:hypothetical protein